MTSYTKSLGTLVARLHINIYIYVYIYIHMYAVMQEFHHQQYESCMPYQESTLVSSCLYFPDKDPKVEPQKTTKNIRILPTMISGFPLILGLGTRMSDPYVHVFWGAPRLEFPRVRGPEHRPQVVGLLVY